MGNTDYTTIMVSVFICLLTFYLPNNKILDWSKLKAFADDKIEVTQKLKIV